MELKTMEIITGRYGKGTPEENKIIDSIFGNVNAEEKFRIYFFWYNVIHELGHAIMMVYNDVRPHPVKEEQLVNDFAVAFWLHYGEDKMINNLKDIVQCSLLNFMCPANIGVTHIDWAIEKWGTDELFNFNNYGWFQFNCVNNSLNGKKPLSSVLKQMNINDINKQSKISFAFPVLTEETVPDILSRAVDALKSWGVALPKIQHSFDNDPNKHMVIIVNE